MQKKQTTKPSKRQLAAAMLVERGLMPQKENVLSAYGVTRIRDLSNEQLDHLIDGLKQMPKPARQPTADVPLEIRRLRSSILSLLDDMGIKAKKNNWEPVNNYLLQPRIAGKLLHKMTEQELKDCAKRLRMVKKKTEALLEEDDHFARHN